MSCSISENCGSPPFRLRFLFFAMVGLGFGSFCSLGLDWLDRCLGLRLGKALSELLQLLERGPQEVHAMVAPQLSIWEERVVGVDEQVRLVPFDLMPGRDLMDECDLV